MVDLCGPMQVAGYGAAASIDGRIEIQTLTQLKLSRIVASAHHLSSIRDSHSGGQHAAVKVILQLRGACVFEQGATRVRVNAGECLVYDVSRPHSILCPCAGEHLVVVIPQDLADSFDLHLTEVGPLHFATQRGLGQVTRSLVEASLDESYELNSGSSEQVSDLLLRSLRLAIQHEKLRASLTPRAALLRRARAYIEEHLGDPALDVERIVAAMGCSRRYLQMAFADEGTTVSNYLWASRLESCRREILRSSGLVSLTELAFSRGFSSSSHFSRRFRLTYGYSPSALLTNCRGAGG
jgi:AraC-like DNA-binding protein